MNNNYDDEKNKEEINKLFSEAREKLDKVDNDVEEQRREMVIKYIQRIKGGIAEERIPSIITKSLNSKGITERFVHECMLKMNERGGT